MRPVGLPCLPLKLRFDVEAQSWSPTSLSSFIARHIEHNLRPRDSQSLYARRNFPALEVFRRRFEVGQSAVRTRADERNVDFRARNRSVRLKLHVDERVFCVLALRGVCNRFGVGNVFVDENRLCGVHAPSYRGTDFRTVEVDHVVVLAALVGCYRFPVLDGFVEVFALRCVRAAFEIFESLFVGIDVADTRAAFDCHIADGHSAFHRHIVEDFSAEFVREADTAVYAEFADYVKRDVFRGNTVVQFAVDVYAADFELLKRKRLGCEHVAHLACTDTECDCAECAVGRRVRVSAGDRHSGVDKPLLGHYNVDYALFARRGVEESYSVVGAIFADCREHFVSHCALVRLGAVVRGDDVVDCCVCARRIFYGKFERAEHTERLRACYFVEKVRAYEQLSGAVGQFPYGVFFPDFFKKRLFHNCCCMLKYSSCRAESGADFPRGAARCRRSIEEKTRLLSGGFFLGLRKFRL